MARDPYKYFRIEARELLDALVQGTLQLEQAAAPPVLARLLRQAHTLKGAARIVKESLIADLAHHLEDVLTPHRETGGPLPAADANAVLADLDGVAARLAALDPTAPVTPPTAPATAPTAPATPPAAPATPPAAPPATPPPHVQPQAPAAPQPSATPPARSPADEPTPTFRVETEEVDALLRGVHETGVQLGAIRRGLGAIERARELAGLLREHLTRAADDPAVALTRVGAVVDTLYADLERAQRGVAVDVERAEGELAELRDVAQRLRLVPARTIFSSLARTVRDAADGLGRRVEFTASGGDERLDAGTLAAVRDALAHAARNAVVHGVEPPAVRAAQGKPTTASVRVTVERRRDRVAFTCADDGRGVDVPAVRAAAVARGLVPAHAAEAMTDADVLTLLRAGGVSTAAELSELAGRGIGMDVVRATAERLRGRLTLRSEPGRGAAIELEVPVSLAALAGLVVSAGGEPATIPLAAVRRTARVVPADISRSSDGDAIVHDGELVPFAPLAPLLRRKPAPGERPAELAVIVRAGGRTAAIAVDRLLGAANVVLHALPATLAADPVVAGASLDAEGNPQLVLDPDGLVAAAVARRGTAPAPPARRPAPVLVVDDSLTTRMLEQAILEAAGYEVDLAVSAEDALELARRRRYGLFIVDVEMPGMNGFEFTARTRADPQLRDTPVILVTSLASPDDRRRGQDAGAGAYIVKGEFDQRQLLQTIRRLLG